MTERQNGPTVERITVREFSYRMRGLVERQATLRRIEIVGEVSGWHPHANGFVYFELKEGGAVLKCTVYPEYVASLPGVKSGDQVAATGSVGVWERDSRYQLVVDRMEPIGVGATAARVEALRRALQSQGLFELARKRAIPPRLRAIALISAAHGAGVDDFRKILRERAPIVRLHFIETRVQGEGAEIDIADAIDRAARLEVDAIFVVRGGGSYEDLLPFNSESVARAIFRARHPVATAIGHAGDRHVADDVADETYKTPSEAAESIARAWVEAAAFLRRADGALRNRMAGIVERAWDRCHGAADVLARVARDQLSERQRLLLALDGRLERASPARQLEQRAKRLATLRVGLEGWPAHAFTTWNASLKRAAERIGATAPALTALPAQRLDLARARLDGCDPSKPLERGYAIVTVGARVLREAHEVAPSDRIAVQLFHGSLRALVEEVDDGT